MNALLDHLPSSTVLLSLLALFVLYFGAPILRAILKPERGSLTDLRIAWFESFVNDIDKRARITEKLAAAAQLPLPPAAPAPAERETQPPAEPVSTDVPPPKKESDA